MTTELTALVACALLALGLALLTVAVHLRAFGGPAIRSSRDDYPPLTGLAGRVVRAQANHGEALLPFAVVTLAAAHLGVSNGVTAGAAEAFLGARIAHASLYLAGVPILRSVAFYAGLVATLVIAAQLPLRFI
ncbi:MAG: MAPEG family protein [Sphingomonadaceae bacterium]|nr:MAPEG family protein [Sphingomonadaceae bacterium]